MALVAVSPETVSVNRMDQIPACSGFVRFLKLYCRSAGSVCEIVSPLGDVAVTVTPSVQRIRTWPVMDDAAVVSPTDALLAVLTVSSALAADGAARKHPHKVMQMLVSSIYYCE